ncbi:hypothetical protein H8F24_17785 [Synechococcus sp. CBW1002]|uniref:hypothetical protein n=1 Tax=Synechococcus sp. CBW1002 TaxID=1353134 RepID=UPI0018CF842D|nr:hypothetical protein [Synechococcus sp. CBW1002]QPN59768.1 hypothetical protein H8F24_17785 [Synechococcus sp. CBW1002]
MTTETVMDTICKRYTDGEAFAALSPDPRQLQTVVPAHLPAWLYWADLIEADDTGETFVWIDDCLPVLAFATFVSDDGYELICGGAVLIPDPNVGPRWVRVISHSRQHAKNPASCFALKLVVGERPELGGKHAPHWIQECATYFSEASSGVCAGPWHA